MITAFGPLATTLLIFGGCCSNVFALEAIIKSEPSSGILITFFQWIFTSSLAYLTQVKPGSPYAVRQPKVPVSRWAFIAAMFYTINMLNNWAFAYNISVPVHIILRSFGSVSTMIAGFLRGKRYSRLQVTSVGLLTVGVLVSAWADSESKGKSMSVDSKTSTSDFTQGLGILLLAQFASAYMGAYVEDTYAKYTADWTENLFYSHFLSLPLFLPLATTLRGQYARLASTAPLPASTFSSLLSPRSAGALSPVSRLLSTLVPLLERTPQGVLFLLVNAVTQLACISGVNLLSAKSSAVTVTIVLNIRKLVSFILSTLLFGHQLNGKMVVGSVLVFGSGALYGWETSWRLPREKRATARAQNGSVPGSKPSR